MCPTANFLATGGFKLFKLFQNVCMVYMHADFAAFLIYAQRGEEDKRLEAVH